MIKPSSETATQVQPLPNSTTFICLRWAARFFVITTIALAIIGIFAACNVGALASIGSYWYLWEIGALGCFITLLIYSYCTQSSLQPITQSTESTLISEANESSAVVSANTTIQEVPANGQVQQIQPGTSTLPTNTVLETIDPIEPPSSPSDIIGEEYTLKWQSFCETTFEAIEVDPQHLANVDPYKLVSWIDLPTGSLSAERKDKKTQKMLKKKQDLIKKCIKDVIDKKNYTNTWMPDEVYYFIRGFLGNDVGSIKTAFKNHCEETLFHLKAIVYLIDYTSGTTPGINHNPLKKEIAEQLCLAFTECIPTWHRWAQHFHHILIVKNIILNTSLSQNTFEELYFKKLFFQAIDNYKDQLVIDGRQLDYTAVNTVWHYLGYFTQKVGQKELGMTLKKDLFIDDATLTYRLELKSNHDLINWFYERCSAEGLITFIMNSIISGTFEYKTGEGGYIFSAYFQNNPDTADNLEQYQDTENDFRPTRLAIAFFLKKFGIITENPQII